MKYHAPTKSFVIRQEQLEHVSLLLLFAIQKVREMGGRPLEGYKRNGPMESPEFAEATILDIARALDIDLGTGDKPGIGVLDVRDRQ